MPVHTKVLAILSEKGGAGKTTFTVHIAVAAYLAGLDVAILDTDPQQASAADWCDRRGTAPEGVALPHVRLKKTIDSLRANETNLIIIDTGRDNNSAAYAAAEAADLCLIPIQPGGFDVRALKLTIDVCRLAGKRPFAVVNGTQPGAKLKVADAWETLADFDCEIAPVVLPRRDVFRAASITTKTAQETEPGSSAADELLQLYLWLSGQIQLSTGTGFNKRTTA
jgi:chromosome partitioning protein